MTIILDHLAFPPSETPRSVEAVGEDGNCYGSTTMEPATNTALAVWGEDGVGTGLAIGDRLNITLEYYPDAIIAITTAARDTTLSGLIDSLTILVVAQRDALIFQTNRADSLQGIVNTFPDTQAEIAQLTSDLNASVALNNSLNSEIANAKAFLSALINILTN